MAKGVGPVPTRWLGTSWKMTKTIAEACAYARALDRLPWSRWPDVTVFVVPSATCLASVHQVLGPQSHVTLGIQNAHWADSGAWTGEISVPQAVDAGARLIEIGHSERREHFAETDITVNRKVHAALRHGATPLVCVGESGDERDAGRSADVVVSQVRAALDGVRDGERVLLAYEPRWAIGEAGTAATPEHVGPVVEALDAEWGDRRPPVLYGGSVTTGNADDFLAVPGVDGLFVGRAAWTVEGLVALLEISSRDHDPRPQD